MPQLQKLLKKTKDKAEKDSKKVADKAEKTAKAKDDATAKTSSTTDKVTGEYNEKKYIPAHKEVNTISTQMGIRPI